MDTPSDATAYGPTLLERFMPDYQFHEWHSITVRATPERVMQAIHAVTPDEVALFRTLMRLRALPVRLMARLNGGSRPPTSRRPGLMMGTGPLLQLALQGGFVLLGQDGQQELVIRPGSGLIRRMWLRAIKRRAEAIEEPTLRPYDGACSPLRIRSHSSEQRRWRP